MNTFEQTKHLAREKQLEQLFDDNIVQSDSYDSIQVAV